MVIDSSALIAIVIEEQDASIYYAAIANSHVRLLSAATFVETSLVLLRRRTTSATAAFDSLVRHLKIEVVSVDHHQAMLAREAFQRFGKGRHPAALNFGDCFSYALAKQAGEPLLYKGSDFGKTDITPA
ncbi:MAG: type II toxin-antitoxin system VapC family toxin [Edaphobacter sp.]